MVLFVVVVVCFVCGGVGVGIRFVDVVCVCCNCVLCVCVCWICLFVLRLPCCLLIMSAVDVIVLRLFFGVVDAGCCC